MSDHIHSRHRRILVTLGGLFTVLALFGIAVWQLLVSSLHSDTMLIGVAIAGGMTILGMVIVAFVAMPRHDWTLTDTGITIRERVSLPFGRRVWVNVPWRDVARLDWSTAGIFNVLDLVTTHGSRYRMSPPRDAAGRSDDQALAAFADRIRARAAMAGRDLPPPGQAAGDLEGAPGLILMTIAFLLSLLLAGLTIWAFTASDGPSGSGRTGYAAGIIIALPVGAGWLLLRALRRRRQLRGQ